MTIRHQMTRRGTRGTCTVLAVAALAAFGPAAHAQKGGFGGEQEPQPGITGFPLTSQNPPSFSILWDGTYAGGPKKIVGGTATLGIIGSGTVPAVTVVGGGPNGFNETTADLTTSTVSLDVPFDGSDPTYSDTYTGSLHYVYDFSPSDPFADTTHLSLTGLLTDPSGQKYSVFIQGSTGPFGAYRTRASFTPVPEASQAASFGLLALGMGGLALAARRRKTADAA